VGRTKAILLSRLQALDVDRPTVTAIGGQTLLVTTARGDADRARAVLVPGSISFTGTGQSKFTALTREAAEAGQRQGATAQLAVVMDNKVITAPQILDAITGDAEISGGSLSRREEADLLAITLDSGALPVRLVITAVETVR
jgi:preprotein translocase subunit SecD